MWDIPLKLKIELIDEIKSSENIGSHTRQPWSRSGQKLNRDPSDEKSHQIDILSQIFKMWSRK